MHLLRDLVEAAWEEVAVRVQRSPSGTDSRPGFSPSLGWDSASGAAFSEVARTRGTSRAAASAIARSASGSRLVYVSEVMVIEEWPSISWMSFRSAPAA
ncbi:hypothetical protein ACFUIW_12990 [Streptomyces sp. NPDC057245]|uniref:hypothetical protein n=1 Tax=Streptomyces TaxID=1883 RepID=UPI0035ABF5CE